MYLVLYNIHFASGIYELSGVIVKYKRHYLCDSDPTHDPGSRMSEVWTDESFDFMGC